MNTDTELLTVMNEHSQLLQVQPNKFQHCMPGSTSKYPNFVLSSINQKRKNKKNTKVVNKYYFGNHKIIKKVHFLR